MGARHLLAFKNIELSRIMNPGKWSLKARILVTSAIFLLLGIASLGVFVSYTLENTFDKSVEDRLSLVEEGVRNELRKNQETLLSLVASVAANPEVVQNLAAQDRNGLMSCVLPYADRVRNSTGYHSLFFHFHTRPGTSFLRTWNVNEWRDDLSKSRPMVARANKEFIALGGIERGHKGLSLRSIIPVMTGIEHIGSVEAGLTLEEIFQSVYFPAHYGAAMVLTEATVSESENPAYVSGEKSRPRIRAAGNVEMATAEMIASEERTFGHYGSLTFRRMELSDFDRHPIGSIFLFFDDYQLLQDKRERVNNFVWLAIVGSVAMWCFLYFSVMKIRAFITQLKRIVMTAQSSNFTARFKTDHVHCREILQCGQES